MEKKYKILAEFIKDLSAETSDVESYIYTKDNISNYKMHIDISTKPLKNKMAEVSISTKFKNDKDSKKCSYFEMIYAVIVKIDDNVNTKKELEPIFLKYVPGEVYPRIEEIFLDLLKYTGYPNVKLETKVDFNELFEKRSN
tara:strand:- start:1530 stop:1952 length:423 start_codon:yes stop_codon:yes gene_type:complete